MRGGCGRGWDWVFGWSTLVRRKATMVMNMLSLYHIDRLVVAEQKGAQLSG